MLLSCHRKYRFVGSNFMRTLLALIFIFSTSCHFDVEVTKKYEQYFDETSYNAVKNGIDAYENDNYKLADSLLSYAIEKSKDKLSVSMPVEFNPYYYRGQNDIELEKY